MPASLWIARLVLALLCVGFAHMLGRVAARSFGQGARSAGLWRWVLRTVVAGLGLLWRAGLDWLSITAYALAALAAAYGIYLERRPRKQEDLSRLIFPGN